MYEETHAAEDEPASRGGREARAAGPKLVLVDQGVAMGEVLAGTGHVIAGGTVVLFVLSRGTPFATKFLISGLEDK
jgi:hypothetical protein